ncbi:MAG TPA: ferritin-like domain-containing protein [Methylomirabilota bacterium]|nr:ferritin-like domain-containing protein [Methylomirabilota bacterium]
MRQPPQQGNNRTGITASGGLGEEMVAATREFRPSSPGTAQAIAEVRVSYVQDDGSLGEISPPASFVDKAKSAITAATGGQPVLLLDKLGERLAFEHSGARLYEALLSKHQAYGGFAGGPSAQDLLHILQEEYEHADMLQQAIEDLGGDPTALTPAANLAANMSSGLPQVLSDPRTNLLQSLEAILVAELADNECWTALEELAAQAGHDELAEHCRQAIEHERDHLRNVRRWVAAGQSRDGAAAGAEPPGPSSQGQARRRA